ncbi:hypothetical protein FHW68_004456 [Pseudomonas sp. Tn43]|uniref:hypothetical protein n=1 Tax=Pseudomonas sp. Tn43 TaxID=701213 RepID=UPI00161596A4|nr:hypothetical protein [Pseudomonas sp. Tn43]MBB3242898.1 hypothetical protein [Pseudomonas sp. Tn43]
MPRRENGGAFFCAEKSKDRSLRQLLPEIVFNHVMCGIHRSAGAAEGCVLFAVREVA